MKNDNLTDREEELEQLSTQQLDHMLQAKLQKEDADPTEVRAILKVLEEREKNMPTQMDDVDQLAWQKYQSRVKEDSDKPIKKQKWILRAACIAAVLCVLSVAVSYNVEAESFWGRIVRWTDSILEIFSPEAPSSEEEVYSFRTNHPGLQQVYDAVTGLGVTEPVVPMWLPEGYELVFCQEINTKNKTTLMAGFQNDEKMISYNVAVYSEGVANQYQKDEAEKKVVDIDSVSHYIVRNYDFWVAVWTKENIECSISIDCQEDELYKVLRSIYDKEEAS